jgi:hypothetical protein
MLDIFSSKYLEASPDVSMFYEDPGGLPYDDLEDFSIPPPLPSPRATGTSRTDGAPDLPPKNIQQKDGSEGFFHEHVMRCDHRLSILNMDLTKRLQQHLVLSQPQDRVMLDTESSSAADRSYTGQEGQSSSKVLNDALADSSTFLAIIQSYSPRSGSTSSTGSISSISPRLGIIVILNLLSVYLQLVATYDKLFQTLTSQLFDTSAGSSAGLELAGFSIHRGNLQTKVLIHAILHQFESIERVLGLPVEFRVTEKQDDYSGLFDKGCARNLLQAMGDGKWRNEPIDDNSELKALFSLREMLKNVQTSLDM